MCQNNLRWEASWKALVFWFSSKDGPRKWGHGKRPHIEAQFFRRIRERFQPWPTSPSLHQAHFYTKIPLPILKYYVGYLIFLGFRRFKTWFFFLIDVLLHLFLAVWFDNARFLRTRKLTVFVPVVCPHLCILSKSFIHCLVSCPSKYHSYSKSINKWHLSTTHMHSYTNSEFTKLLVIITTSRYPLREEHLAGKWYKLLRIITE